MASQLIDTQLLSGSTNGLGILVAATADPGTTLHTAHATAHDEITLWAYNTDTVDRVVTLEWGGNAAKDLIAKLVPTQGGLFLLVDGLRLTGSVVVKAYAAAANKIVIFGTVNRVS